MLIRQSTASCTAPLDKLGFFATTCSKTSFKAMSAEVDQQNTKWQLMVPQHYP
jgi:hypothetical protein